VAVGILADFIVAAPEDALEYGTLVRQGNAISSDRFRGALAWTPASPYRCARAAFSTAVLFLLCVLLPVQANAGLDLIPLGKAKPGHEAEWQQLMEVLYQGGRLGEEQINRLHSISIAPTGDGAGLPNYSNSAITELDSTSFRGSFLRDCDALLGSELLDRAWTYVMRPADAVAYGKQLLAIADQAAEGKITPAFPQKKNEGVGSEKPIRKFTVAVEEQIDILRAAGAWYVYWGERGHPIYGWW
jgi:hypothetical protein